MKKFILNSIIFAVLLIIINLIFRSILGEIYFNEYYEIDLNKEFYMLSDSHGDVLGDFEHEKVYNFSKGGDSYLDMKNKLNFLIKNTQVKTVIITADDHTLSPYRDTSNNSDRSSFFKSREDYTNYSEFLREKYFSPNLVLIEPKYGVLLNKFFKSFVIPTSREDQAWSLVSEKEREKKSLKRFKDQFEYNESSILLKHELIEIINICKINNIELIGLKFPLSRQYNKVRGNKSFYADQLLMNNNIKIYNFNTPFFEKDELFHDQDHLNRDGAQIFKQAFLSEVVEPL